VKKNNEKRLVEKKLKSDVAFKGSFLQVLRDQVELPNGKPATREYVLHNGAAMIIPVTDQGQLIMLRQYRYAVQKVFIEFPAGKTDPGEDTLQTAKRELEEEIGMTADQLQFLTTIHPVIGYSNEKIDLYLAKGLKKSKQHLDEEEFLELFEISFEDAMELMKKGDITDVKTMIGLFWYQQILKAKW